MSANDFSQKYEEFNEAQEEFDLEDQNNRVEKLLSQWQEARDALAADPEQALRPENEYKGIEYRPLDPPEPAAYQHPKVEALFAIDEIVQDLNGIDFAKPEVTEALAALGYPPESPAGQERLKAMLLEAYTFEYGFYEGPEYFVHDDAPATALAWQQARDALHDMNFESLTDRLAFAEQAAALLLEERVTFVPKPEDAAAFQNACDLVKELIVDSLATYRPTQESSFSLQDMRPELIVALNHWDDPTCQLAIADMIENRLDSQDRRQERFLQESEWPLEDPANYGHPTLNPFSQSALQGAAAFIAERHPLQFPPPEDYRLAPPRDTALQDNIADLINPYQAGWVGIKGALITRDYPDRESYVGFVQDMLDTVNDKTNHHLFPESHMTVNDQRLQQAQLDYLLAAPHSEFNRILSNEEMELIGRLDAIEKSLLIYPNMDTTYEQMNLLEFRPMQEAALSIGLDLFHEEIKEAGLNPAADFALTLQPLMEADGTDFRMLRMPALTGAEEPTPEAKALLQEIQIHYLTTMDALATADPEKYRAVQSYWQNQLVPAGPREQPEPAVA